MRYIVESIGAEFSDKDLPKLAGTFTRHAEQGYKFHSVFQVSQPGCLGIGSPSTTYLAVYVSDDD